MIGLRGPAASAVILADRESTAFTIDGLAEALRSTEEGEVDVRIFGKPTTRPYRRMGVALALAKSTDAAREVASRAASLVTITYET